MLHKPWGSFLDMQPIASTNNPNQFATTARTNSTEQTQVSQIRAVVENEPAGHQTGSMITLSKDSLVQNSASKKASIPVSSEEKAALLNNSFNKPKFSIYV
jgi:hypothetical protein